MSAIFFKYRFNQIVCYYEADGGMVASKKYSISSTDFLGSTNAQLLIFKANNVRAALLDYDNTLAGANGRTVKAFSLPNKGVGQLSFSTAGFPAGMYVFTLIVDGEEADSRQLITAK